MKYLLSYTAVEDFLPLAQQHGDAHRARLGEFLGRRLLLMAGPLDEPFNGDALCVFTTRDAAEAFATGDPFVLNGVVAQWSIRPWQEALVP